MSITRSWLKGIGIEAEKVEAIIEAHTEVTSRMQAEIDELKPFKDDAKKLPKVQKDLDEATKKIAEFEESATANEKKYKEEHEAFEAFKKDVESKEATTKLKDAYKALLKANNVDEKRFDAILRVTDFEKLKLNDEGKFDNEKELNDAIKADWEGFIVKTEDRGQDVENPPANSGAKAKTKEQIMAIKDRNERQKAIAENPELFGIE